MLISMTGRIRLRFKLLLLPPYEAPASVSPLHPRMSRYYNAVIDMIADDGETCSVTFDGYGTTVIVKVPLFPFS